jgi:hypothetical protein
MFRSLSATAGRACLLFRRTYAAQAAAVPSQVRLHLLRLGLQGHENWEQIRQRYRELARSNHPDVPGGSTENFQAIQDSYNYLSVYYGHAKPSTRHGYRAAARSQGGAPYYRSTYAEHVQRTNGSPGLFLVFPALLLVGLGSWVIIQSATGRSQRGELRAGGTSQYVPENRQLILPQKPDQTLFRIHRDEK